MMYILHWHMNFNRFRTELCNELILLLFFPFFFLPSIFMLTFRSYVHQLSNSSRCILLVRELGYEEGKTRKIWMERSRCCSSWGTCGLVRGAKEGKKEERRDTGYYNCAGSGYDPANGTCSRGEKTRLECTFFWFGEEGLWMLRGISEFLKSKLEGYGWICFRQNNLIVTFMRTHTWSVMKWISRKPNSQIFEFAPSSRTKSKSLVQIHMIKYIISETHCTRFKIRLIMIN